MNFINLNNANENKIENDNSVILGKDKPEEDDSGSLIKSERSKIIKKVWKDQQKERAKESYQELDNVNAYSILPNPENIQARDSLLYIKLKLGRFIQKAIVSDRVKKEEIDFNHEEIVLLKGFCLMHGFFYKDQLTAIINGLNMNCLEQVNKAIAYESEYLFSEEYLIQKYFKCIITQSLCHIFTCNPNQITKSNIQIWYSYYFKSYLKRLHLTYKPIFNQFYDWLVNRNPLDKDLLIIIANCDKMYYRLNSQQNKTEMNRVYMRSKEMELFSFLLNFSERDRQRILANGEIMETRYTNTTLSHINKLKIKMLKFFSEYRKENRFQSSLKKMLDKQDN